MQRDSSKTRLTDSYFQCFATPTESDRVTTDTEFLSCSLAGRESVGSDGTVSSKIWRHTKHPYRLQPVATDREVWCVNGIGLNHEIRVDCPQTTNFTLKE